MRSVNAIATLLAFSLCVLSPKISTAQTAPGTPDVPPSDNDLFAAYCLGVVTEQETILSSLPASQRGSPDTLNRNKARFLGYLLSENMLGNMGSLIALKNGEVDEKDAFDAFGTTCPFKPSPPIEDYLSKGEQWYDAQVQANSMVVIKCVSALPSFQRAKRCQDPSKLPF